MVTVFQGCKYFSRSITYLIRWYIYKYHCFLFLDLAVIWEHLMTIIILCSVKQNGWAVFFFFDGESILKHIRIAITSIINVQSATWDYYDLCRKWIHIFGKNVWWPAVGVVGWSRCIFIHNPYIWTLLKVIRYKTNCALSVV